MPVTLTHTLTCAHPVLFYHTGGDTETCRQPGTQCETGVTDSRCYSADSLPHSNGCVFDTGVGKFDIYLALFFFVFLFLLVMLELKVLETAC